MLHRNASRCPLAWSVVLDLHADPIALTAALVDIPSVSRDEARIAGELERIEFTLPPDKLGLTDLVYRRGTVLERHDNDDGSVSLQVLATAVAKSEIEGRLGLKIKG